MLCSTLFHAHSSSLLCCSHVLLTPPPDNITNTNHHNYQCQWRHNYQTRWWFVLLILSSLHSYRPPYVWCFGSHNIMICAFDILTLTFVDLHFGYFDFDILNCTFDTLTYTFWLVHFKFSLVKLTRSVGKNAMCNLHFEFRTNEKWNLQRDKWCSKSHQRHFPNEEWFRTNGKTQMANEAWLSGFPYKSK